MSTWSMTSDGARRALDVRVGRELFGFQFCDSPGDLELPAKCSLFGLRHYSADGVSSDDSDDLPRYSADIASAWPLVEHMLNGKAFAVLVSGNHESGWMVRVDVDSTHLTAERDVAPAAICAAALMYAEYVRATAKKYGTLYGTENHSTPHDSL